MTPRAALREAKLIHKMSCSFVLRRNIRTSFVLDILLMFGTICLPDKKTHNHSIRLLCKQPKGVIFAKLTRTTRCIRALRGCHTYSHCTSSRQHFCGGIRSCRRCSCSKSPPNQRASQASSGCSSTDSPRKSDCRDLEQPKHPAEMLTRSRRPPQGRTCGRRRFCSLLCLSFMDLKAVK